MVASSTTKCRCWHSGSVVLDRVISYVCFCHCVFKKEVVVRLQINLITVYTVINNHRIYVFMKIFVLVYQPLTIFLFSFFFFFFVFFSAVSFILQILYEKKTHYRYNFFFISGMKFLSVVSFWMDQSHNNGQSGDSREHR